MLKQNDWSLSALVEEYPDLGSTPSWVSLDDEYGDGPGAELPPPVNVRVDWLRVAVLGLVAALLLVAGRWR